MFCLLHFDFVIHFVVLKIHSLNHIYKHKVYVHEPCT